MPVLPAHPPVQLLPVFAPVVRHVARLVVAVAGRPRVGVSVVSHVLFCGQRSYNPICATLLLYLVRVVTVGGRVIIAGRISLLFLVAVVFVVRVIVRIRRWRDCRQRRVLRGLAHLRLGAQVGLMNVRLLVALATLVVLGGLHQAL